ncbi:hypothetical protein L3i22_088470 [Actinoplanes sp. L3-i22]|nr:hypothetical protein L3i22_088470 [Actinoplanes sp. L3-i22]
MTELSSALTNWASTPSTSTLALVSRAMVTVHWSTPQFTPSLLQPVSRAAPKAAEKSRAATRGAFEINTLIKVRGGSHPKLWIDPLGGG